MKTLSFQKKNIYHGDLILVNSTHPIKDEPLSIELMPIHSDYAPITLRKSAGQKLNQLMKAIGCIENVEPISGYRSEYEQVSIYEDCLREDGVGYTTSFVAIPNCSEHQTGLAIDLAEKKHDIDYICPDFPYTGICQTFRKNAAKYGFIERYKKDKEAITNVAQEPWHFRYVGCPHAQIIEEQGFTLEEYIESLKQYSHKDSALRRVVDDRVYEIFYMPFGEADEISVELPEKACCQISGNNEDGLIITLWEKLSQ